MMLPKIENVANEPTYGRYHVEPLEPGFGVTVGNAIRRVLLSSLPGAAVTSIKIDNVFHEFSAIPGVKEDTTELVLNVKQIRLRSFADRPVSLRIEASGSGEVTAADIIAPPDVEIVNPELHLATLDGEESRLVMEMTVERGKGYIPAESRDGLAIGVIPVDAIYTPTRRVNYSVEPVRVGTVTDYERLVLEVWTDGTMTPDESVANSAQILIRHFELLTDLVVKPTARFEKPTTSQVSIPAKLYDVPIEDLDLTVRAYNCLKRAGITKVGQVLEMSEDDLLGVRNFGRKSLDELKDRLSERGFLEGSRLAATSSTAAGAEEEEEEEEGEVPTAAAVEEAAYEAPVPAAPTAAAPTPAAPTRIAPPRPAPIQVSDEELEDFTRSPSPRVRAQPPPPRPVEPAAAAEEEEEEVPEYTFDFEEFAEEEEEEEEERPRHGRRRR
ncbi:MAG TPA: DNA-directed RNA polymerase subunit alpha [Chloroflexota bacterium]|nr:DNA-directed RNA polymerase subunit alpha [Chloroflexota bacterium]